VARQATYVGEGDVARLVKLCHNLLFLCSARRARASARISPTDAWRHVGTERHGEEREELFL
jgi:hypothetical protein